MVQARVGCSDNNSHRYHRHVVCTTINDVVHYYLHCGQRNGQVPVLKARHKAILCPLLNKEAGHDRTYAVDQLECAQDFLFERQSHVPPTLYDVEQMLPGFMPVFSTFVPLHSCRDSSVSTQLSRTRLRVPSPPQSYRFVDARKPRLVPYACSLATVWG